MSDSKENLVSFPEKTKTQTIIKTAEEFARLGADFEVLCDQLKYVEKFSAAIQKLAVNLKKTLLNASFETFATPFPNEDGEFRSLIIPGNLPESIEKSFNLNYYWFNVSNAPGLKNLTNDLAELYQKTLAETSIESINLNIAIKNVYNHLIDNNLKKEWIVVENLQDFDSETFWYQYLEHYKTYQEIQYLSQSNRQKQYNIDHLRITAENLERQKEDCLTSKKITTLDRNVCQTDLTNNITDFQDKLENKQSEWNTIQEKLKKVELQKNNVETDLNKTKKSLKEIQKLNSITLSEKNHLIQLKKEEIVEKNRILKHLTIQNRDLEAGYLEISTDLHNLNKNNLKIQEQYKDCLINNNESLINYENCLTNARTVSVEEQFQKLKESWDQKILRDRLEAKEFNCHKNFLKFRTIYEKETQKAIENVTESCRKDASTLMDINEQLGKEAYEFQRQLKECQMPKLSLPESDKITNVSYQDLFGKGLTQLFAWSITFVLWPMALHNPDSELWELLGEICGMKIKKGPTGVVRRWTCEFLALVLSMLWWLFLLALGKKFLWNSQEVNRKNWNEQEAKKSSNQITKWQKLKQKIARLGKKISKLVEIDEENVKVTYGTRGGAVTPVAPILEYHDFLLFVTIHTFKILNSDVIARTKVNLKSFQLTKNESKFTLIWDKLMNVIGPIVFVAALSSAQLPNTLQSFHDFQMISQIQSSTNSSMPLKIYSDQFQNQVEFRAMNFAKAELEAESKIETQIQKPKTKTKLWGKRFKKKRKSNFSGKRLKRSKQVKKLSDLPSLDNLKKNDIIEQEREPNLRIIMNKKIRND